MLKQGSKTLQKGRRWMWNNFVCSIHLSLWSLTGFKFDKHNRQNSWLLLTGCFDVRINIICKVPTDFCLISFDVLIDIQFQEVASATDLRNHRSQARFTIDCVREVLWYCVHGLLVYFTLAHYQLQEMLQTVQQNRVPLTLGDRGLCSYYMFKLFKAFSVSRELYEVG